MGVCQFAFFLCPLFSYFCLRAKIGLKNLSRKNRDRQKTIKTFLISFLKKKIDFNKLVWEKRKKSIFFFKKTTTTTNERGGCCVFTYIFMRRLVRPSAIAEGVLARARRGCRYGASVFILKYKMTSSFYISK